MMSGSKSFSQHDEMSEIGISIQEANHMEKITGIYDQQKEVEKPIVKKKSQPKVVKSTNSIQASVSNLPLRGQAEAAARNVVLKWSVASHKLESLLTKSSKIIESLENNASRHGIDVKLTGIEKEASLTFSHIFNVQFGVNDKDEALCKWFLSLQERNTQETNQPLPQLK